MKTRFYSFFITILISFCTVNAIYAQTPSKYLFAQNADGVHSTRHDYESTVHPHIPKQDFIAAKPLNYDQVCKTISYPKRAIEDGVEGMVKVHVLITDDGIYSHHLVLSSPAKMLTQAVEAQLTELKFQPATQNGKSTGSWLSVPFVFQLTD